MGLNKIAQKQWTYTLYESQGTYVLSVVCGGVGVYELNIPLTADDAEKAILDSAYLDKLVSEIANNPHKFASKSIQI